MPRNICIEKCICAFGLILFILGLLFIIVSFSTLPLNNITNTNIPIIAGWGLLLMAISLFIIIGIINVRFYSNNNYIII